jgi:hypothetical protein
MHPNKRNFVLGLELIFARWPAMQLCLQMEWGGFDTAAKACEFQAGLIDYFDRGMVSMCGVD